MHNMFTNATVWWNEREIEYRDTLIRNIYQIVKDTLLDMNRAIKFKRVETPILTPPEALPGHIEAGWDKHWLKTEHGVLRPETTAGTYEAFKQLFVDNTPQQHLDKMLQKVLPICLWQAGLSFRNEAKPQSMRTTRLRLRQFYQLEFQIFAAQSTGADYLSAVMDSLIKAYGGESVIVPEDDLSHYSKRTIDWEIDGIEAGGLSIRTDWEYGKVYEISLGLDRLVKMTMDKNE